MTYIEFDDNYYFSIMTEFGYDPLQFGKIDFSLGNLDYTDLQRRWLCHHDGDQVANALSNGNPAIVSTGLGLSGNPHVGTLSQILKAISLQSAGVPVNLVLGDLDAYNGKSRPLKETLSLVDKYLEFITLMGFRNDPPSMIRSQYDELEVLRVAYLIGHYMTDEMFDEAEEDLHDFYSSRGRVDKSMSYRRKLSLNLMTADFIDLYLRFGYKQVLVILGIDEHKYVQFGKQTLEKIKKDPNIQNFDFLIAGLYSPLIKGLYGYPKMSKSFPDSGITVDMKPDDIIGSIMEGEGEFDKPENNVVYQMMSGASNFSPEELKEAYMACKERESSYMGTKKKGIC